MLTLDDFKPVLLEDREKYEEILKNAHRKGSEYTFSNLYMWSRAYDMKVAQIGDTLIFKFFTDHCFFSFPIGEKNVVDALNAIIKSCENCNHTLEIINIDEYGKKILEENFSGKFLIEENRDNYDYIYNADDLINLKGRAYSSKRNHISKFKISYPNWKYEKITEENIDDVKNMNNEWFTAFESQKGDGIKIEKQAVHNALDNFSNLNLLGGLIRVDENVVAYTFGSPTDNETFDIHVEKALPSYNGTYSIINQQFAQNELSDYKYINREEDAGVEIGRAHV